MDIGTIVLCDATSTGMARGLQNAGFDVHAVTHSTNNWVANASISMLKSVIVEPAILVAHGSNCEDLPSVGWARRSAHKPAGGYVLIDPTTTPIYRGQGDGDWPDAPVIVLTHGQGSDEQRAAVMQSRLRGWTVVQYSQDLVSTFIEALRP